MLTAVKKVCSVLERGEILREFSSPSRVLFQERIIIRTLFKAHVYLTVSFGDIFSRHIVSNKTCKED